MKDFQEYKTNYEKSINNTEEFLKEQATKLLSWDKNFETVFNPETDTFFDGGELSPCFNALDRHAKLSPNKTAFISVDNNNNSKFVTYRELLSSVIKISYTLKNLGLQKGDTVTFFAVNSYEMFSCVLACGRLGLMSNFVFGGFSYVILSERIKESNTKLVITVDIVERGETKNNFYNTVVKAVNMFDYKGKILVFNSNKLDVIRENTFLWSNLRKKSYEYVKCVSMRSSDPLLCLYTSGSSGKSKGIVHSTAGFLLRTMMTLSSCFNFNSNSIFFSTADIGWLAAISHSIYGPLLLGGTSIVFAGTPFHPSFLRLFDLISKYKVTHFYTAPTVIRMMNRYINEHHTSIDNIKKIYDLSSLKVIGTVGEILNEGSALSLEKMIGNNVPIINTYWQTETGSVMLSPLPISQDVKFPLNSVGVPAYCIKPLIVKKNPEDGSLVECGVNEKGLLLFKGVWPSLCKTILNDHKAYLDSYFKPYPGYYFTGDEALRDENGFYYILGRIDDVINVSGHRISTSEIESIVSSTEGISEAAVVGYDDDVVGTRIYVHAVCLEGYDQEDVRNKIKCSLRQNMGAITKHHEILFHSDLPKTRTGKIMRRLLRKDSGNVTDNDISSCYNMEVLNELFKGNY